MNCTCYLRKDIVYIPTWARTTDGLYVTVAPIEVLPVGNTVELLRAFEEAIGRGNPVVPAPDFRNRDPSTDVCRYVGVKNWSTFERGLTRWTIAAKDGVYQIKTGHRQPDRSWQDDPDQRIIFPLETTIAQVCARIVAIIQEKARE